MRWQYLEAVEPIFPRKGTGEGIGWLPDLPLPARRRELPTALLLAAGVLVPVVVAQATPLGWDHALSTPTRSVQRLQYETGAERPIEVPEFQQLDWYPQIEVPVRARLRVLPGTGAEAPTFTPAVVAPLLAWQSPLSEPYPARRAVPRETGAEQPLTVRVVPPLGWSPSQPPPLPVTARLQYETGAELPPVQPAVVTPPLSWYQPLSLPVRAPTTLRLDAAAAEPVIPWAPPPAVAYWYPSLPDGRLLTTRPLAPLLPAAVIVEANVPVPPLGVRRDLITLGSELSMDISPDPVLGGRGSW